jgi:hypothetical protein
MIRPRESARTRQKPFRMTVQEYHLDVSADVVGRVADEWISRQAGKPIPFQSLSKRTQRAPDDSQGCSTSQVIPEAGGA